MSANGDEMETGISLLVSVDQQSLRSARQEIEETLGDSVTVDVDVNVGDTDVVDPPTPELPEIDRPELGQPEIATAPELPEIDRPELDPPEIAGAPGLPTPDVADAVELPVPVAVADGAIEGRGAGSAGREPRGSGGQNTVARSGATPELPPPEIAAPLPEPSIVTDGGGVATDGGPGRRVADQQLDATEATADTTDRLLRVARDIEDNTEGGGGAGRSGFSSALGGGVVGRIIGGGSGGLLGGALSGGLAGLLARGGALSGPAGAILGGGALTIEAADRLDDLSLPLSDQAADVLRAPFAGVGPMLETNFEILAGAVETLTGFELTAPDIPDVGVPDIPSLNVPNIPDLEVPDLPTLEVPDLPTLDVPDLPTLDVPDLPSLPLPDPPGSDFLPDISLPANIDDVLSLKVPPLPSFIPVAPTQSLISTIGSFVSNIGDGGGPLDSIVSGGIDLGQTAIGATPGGLAFRSTSAFLDSLSGGDGSDDGGVPPGGQRPAGSDSVAGLPESPGPDLGQPTQPVRVTSEFDTTINLGDISVEVTADFDQLRRDLLSEVRSALDSQRQDLEREIDSVQDDIERETDDLERRISRAVSTTQ